VVAFSVVLVELPYWLVLLFSLFKVETPSLPVQRQHGIWVHLYRTEAGIFAHVSCYRAGDEVKSDGLSTAHSSDHLPHLRVHVAIGTEPNYMLEPFEESM